MHDFVFVSHSNADKPRIKVIVDRLIASGLRVWLDRPEEMGYSAEQIRRSFLRIRPGKPWKDEIDEAALRSGCLLLMASQRVLDEARHHWHDEIRFGHAGKKLIAARLELVDLSSIPIRGRDISAFQKVDLFLSDIRATTELTCRQATSLDLLIDAVSAMLNQSLIRESETRYGAGPQNSPFTNLRPPTTEQLDSLMTLLARENEVTVAVRGGCASVLTGLRSAKVEYFKDRLPKVELPCRSIQMKGVSEDFRSLEAIRADILAGQIDIGNFGWELIDVAGSWEAKNGAESNVRAFLHAVLDRLGISGELPSDPVEFGKLLEQRPHRVFIYTALTNDGANQSHTLQFITQVARWFSNAPEDRVRLAIRASPGQSWWFRNPSRWLRSACAACGTTALEFGDVARNELLAWEEILYRMVALARGEITDSVDAAFSKRSHRISIEALEQHLRPIVSQWPLKQRGKASNGAMPSQKWQDAYV